MKSMVVWINIYKELCSFLLFLRFIFYIINYMVSILDYLNIGSTIRPLYTKLIYKNDISLFINIIFSYNYHSYILFF